MGIDIIDIQIISANKYVLGEYLSIYRYVRVFFRNRKSKSSRSSKENVFSTLVKSWPPYYPNLRFLIQFVIVKYINLAAVEK